MKATLAKVKIRIALIRRWIDDLIHLRWVRRKITQAYGRLNRLCVKILSRVSLLTAHHGYPIKEAAERAYLLTRNSNFASFAELNGNTFEGAVRYYMNAMLDQTTIYGQLPPSRKFVTVNKFATDFSGRSVRYTSSTKTRYRYDYIQSDCKSLGPSPDGRGMPCYTNLRVMRGDLKKFVKWARST